jgi:hypothetical protein
MAEIQNKTNEINELGKTIDRQKFVKLVPLLNLKHTLFGVSIP